MSVETATATKKRRFVRILASLVFCACIEAGSCAEAGECAAGSDGDGTCLLRSQSQRSLARIAAKDTPGVDCDSAVQLVANLDPEEADKISDTQIVSLKRNGMSFGNRYTWKPGCALTMVRKAAVIGGIRPVDLEWPVYLYTADGYPVTSAALDSEADVQEVEKSGLLHWLLDEEAWVWPGEHPGHTWESEGARYTTLSMMPKVIMVENVLAPETCDKLVDEGRPGLYKSPEKHYSDDPKFHNYRTSSTAGLRSAEAEALRTRSERIARLDPGSCEMLQLVQYTPGQWYKEHNDYYHNWKSEETETVLKNYRTWRSGVYAACNETLEEFAGAGEDAVDLELAKSIVKNGGISGVDPAWLQWLQENIERRANGLIESLLQNQPNAIRITQFLEEVWDYHHSTEKGRECMVGDLELAKKAFVGLRRRGVVQPNRHATLFIYLNDDFEGGETVFPIAYNANPEAIGDDKQLTAVNGSLQVIDKAERPGMDECGRGLRVVPKKGAAALFYSMTPDGMTDYMSMHGGCPPSNGVKYGSNAFMWNSNVDDALLRWVHLGGPGGTGIKRD